MARCAFRDEYVRHKVLDLIGDLALAGRRIEGHVVAERAGHAMHTALVSRLHEGPLGLGTGPCAGGSRANQRNGGRGESRNWQPCPDEYLTT